MKKNTNNDFNINNNVDVTNIKKYKNIDNKFNNIVINKRNRNTKK